ncbi:MAG TPA: hypothetical protein ENH10_06940, partial [Bacteroidetes bacterium]|nr:hypothetical protein [Bacteroidota bacterium]HEX04877.1 hypothetical protein [Bacteroidota bacterium]
VDAVYEDGTLRLNQASFMDVLTVNGEIDFDAQMIQEMIMRIERMDLADLLPVSMESEFKQIGGIVSGRFNMSGPFNSPDIDSHFELSEGQYGELSDYWGLLTLNTERGKVNIQQGAFGRKSTTLFTLIGGYDIEEDSLGLNIESPSSDANVIMTTMTGQKDLLTGDANLRGFVHGSLSRPSWLAELDMNVGTLAGIEFEKIHARLHGVSSERLGHVVYVDTASLSRPDYYELTISGAVPLDRGAGELDISLEGDILGIFPQTSDFIIDASGRGLLDWSTTIVAGKPVAARGQLTVEHGRVEFADVFPEMTNLDVDITIDSDGLVNIRQAQGIFQNEYAFAVSNLPGEDSDSTRQAIRFRSPEIDLGVLKMRTLDDEGIPFRLPGINTTEQYSRLAVSGKHDDWLTIAGPADSLFIDGQLRLLSSVFTYPPIVEENQVDILSAILPREALFLGENNTSTVTETPAFINNARWDVQASIGNDVKYERIVKGLENAPFLETFSEFLGQIELDVDLEPTDPDFPINVTGVIADSTFRMNGTIVSSTGRIEFLDMLFSMDRAEIVFDQTSVYPVVSARAVANVAKQDFTRQMYLTLYVIDPVTGERRQRGRWGEITFVLEDEAGSSQEEVLSAMGVGISDLQGLQNRVITSGAGGLDRAMARRWLGPVERDAAEFLGLDIVQFRPQLATNLVGPKPTDIFYNTTEEDQRTAANTGSRNLFRASRVVLGKFMDRNTYISYTGQFGEEARYASVEDIQLGRLGLLQ